MTTPILCVNLGHQPYPHALDLQRTLRLQRLDGSLQQDLLLLVEHPPVYTMGRGTRSTSLPLSPDELRARGAEVAEVERGGDVTWHGPGQLVGYPILHLSAYREDLHWYLRTLEQVLVSALASLGIEANPDAGRTGVWTSGRKIASIGVHVKQWVTLHGFALNVDPDLGWFDPIVPCGLHGVTMTSIAAELASHRNTLWQESVAAVGAAFGSGFGRPVEMISLESASSRIETFAQLARGVS